MKRFEDYEKAYNKCYELLQKLMVLVKDLLFLQTTKSIQWMKLRRK